MSTIDRVHEQYAKALRDAHARHDGLVAQVDREHASAVQKATATHTLALRAAEDRATTDRAKADAGLPAALDAAHEQFDAGCRRAHGVPDALIILGAAGRLELRDTAAPGRPLLATALHLGSESWSVTSAAERQFVNGAPSARAALWRIAVTRPMPVSA